MQWIEVSSLQIITTGYSYSFLCLYGKTCFDHVCGLPAKCGLSLWLDILFLWLLAPRIWIAWGSEQRWLLQETLLCLTDWPHSPRANCLQIFLHQDKWFGACSADLPASASWALELKAGATTAWLKGEFVTVSLGVSRCIPKASEDLLTHAFISDNPRSSCKSHQSPGSLPRFYLFILT